MSTYRARDGQCLLVAMAVAAGLLAAGCGSSCEELQAVCNECEDPYHRASCEMSVDRGDSDQCELDRTDFCAICGRRYGTLAEACN